LLLEGVEVDVEADEVAGAVGHPGHEHPLDGLADALLGHAEVGGCLLHGDRPGCGDVLDEGEQQADAPLDATVAHEAASSVRSSVGSSAWASRMRARRWRTRSRCSAGQAMATSEPKPVSSSAMTWRSAWWTTSRPSSSLVSRRCRR